MAHSSSLYFQSPSKIAWQALVQTNQVSQFPAARVGGVQPCSREKLLSCQEVKVTFFCLYQHVKGVSLDSEPVW